MREFKVGDRVRAYFCLGGIRTGRIQAIHDSIVDIHGDNNKKFQAHTKQCRLLKKKIKPVPREIWVNDSPVGLSSVCFDSAEEAMECCSPKERTIKFREVI